MLHLTLFKMGLFWGYPWKAGGELKGPPYLKSVAHISQLTITKLGTVIPHLKKIQKMFKSRDTHLECC